MGANDISVTFVAPRGGDGTPLHPLGRHSERRPRERLISHATSMLDVALLLLAGLLAGMDLLAAGVFAVVAALLLTRVTQRSARLTLRLTDDLGQLLGRLLVGLLAAAVIAGSTEPVVPAGLWAGALLLLSRSLTYSLVKAGRRRGLLDEPALIVGAGTVGVAVARILQERPEYGLRPIGFVDRVTDELSLPLVGAPEELDTIVRSTGVRRIFLAFGHTREAEMVAILRRCAALPVEVYTLPRFFELGCSADPRATDDLWGFPIVRLRGGGAASRRRIKRAFDLVVTALLMPVVVVVGMLCAVAVHLSSPGPVLFRQERVGENGRRFQLLKFRTMTENADSDTTWSVENDQRVTAVGRVLRPTHLDELPQLWNVIKGEMSIVGPRPERPAFVDRFDAEIPNYTDRHRVPVGLTGWSQVNGLWGDTSIPDRVRLDNNYIERWSLGRDVVILFRTIPTLLGRRGA